MNKAAAKIAQASCDEAPRHDGKVSQRTELAVSSAPDHRGFGDGSWLVLSLACQSQRSARLYGSSPVIRFISGARQGLTLEKQAKSFQLPRLFAWHHTGKKINNVLYCMYCTFQTPTSKDSSLCVCVREGEKHIDIDKREWEAMKALSKTK